MRARDGPVAASGWKSAKIIIMMILGLGCVIMFAFWECLYPHPLLNPSIWRDRNFTLCVLCVFFGYMSFAANEFWFAFYMQNVKHMTSLRIALHLLPFAFAGPLWIYLCNKLLQRLNGTILMGAGSLGYLVSSILLVFHREDTPYWKLIFPALILMVLGVDFQFLVSNVSHFTRIFTPNG